MHFINVILYLKIQIISFKCILKLMSFMKRFECILKNDHTPKVKLVSFMQAATNENLC